MLRKVIKILFLSNNNHSAKIQHSKTINNLKNMKTILKKEKMSRNNNSIYKNTLFVGIIALTLFNLSNANAEMMNRGERGQMQRETERDNRENRMGINNGLERGQKDIVATVTAINGNTFTVSEIFRGEGKNATTTPKIYTVDVSSAKFVKAGATTTVSSIVIGDKISIVGAINGSNITAKVIREAGNLKAMEMAGDGKPVVEGKITGINGNIITITNKSNVVYTIDASTAKIFVNNATNTISTLKVNDEIVVQGTVNGTNITATNIMTHQDKNIDSNNPNKRPGFFEKTKNFFKKMFGF